MAGIGRFSGIALECREPRVLAEFYAAVSGWQIVFDSDDWVSLGQGVDATWHLSFQRAPQHVPPSWPDPHSSMQFHLHFRVDDLDGAETAVLRQGATKNQTQPGPATARVYADPAGHPFCLVAAQR